MRKLWVLGASLVLLAQGVGCNAEKKAAAAAASASAAAGAAAASAAAAQAAASAAPAAPAVPEELIPNTPELKKEAEYYYKEAHKKPKPATGIPGVRVMGGCTQDKVMSGVKVGCYTMKRDFMIYLQNELLTQDGWTIDKKTRGVGNEVLLEASKGSKKIGLAISSKTLGTAEIAEMTIMPR